MGLFDGWGDPNEAAYMALASGLLSGKGSLGSIFGKSMMGAGQVYQDTAQSKRRNELTDLQKQQFQLALAEETRKAKQFEDREKWRKSIPYPGAVGPDGMGPPEQASPQSELMYGAMRAGELKPLDYILSQQKDNAPRISKPGDIARDANNNILWQNPQESKEPEALRALKLIYGDGSPEYMRASKLYGEKLASHQPQVSVSYGAPVAGVDAAGKSVFFQPTKDGKPPSIIPGVAPPRDPNALKLGEAQKKQVVGIDALSSAVDEYTKELATFPLTGVINPADRARIGTKYNNMMLQAKEAYNLGVLNGPDYQILQSVVADPVSLRGITTSNRSLALQANELKRMMQQVKAGITKADAKEPDNDPLGLRKP